MLRIEQRAEVVSLAAARSLADQDQQRQEPRIEGRGPALTEAPLALGVLRDVLRCGPGRPGGPGLACLPVEQDGRVADETVPEVARFLVPPGVPEEHPAHGMLLLADDDVRAAGMLLVEEALCDLSGFLVRSHSASTFLQNNS